MKDFKNIKELAKRVATNSASTTEFSQSQAQDALRKEISKLAPDYNTYKKNQYLVFELIQETIDEIVPNRIATTMGAFAEFKTVPHSAKAIFKVLKGRQRGRQFVTQVALSGVYEAFRLDAASIEVSAKAYGGSAYMELESYLAGSVTFNDLLDVFMLGLEDKIYGEIQTALLASYNDPNRPTNNNVSSAGFDADEMNKLIALAKSYGSGATIFCTSEFAATMVPAQGWAARADIDALDMRNQGHIGTFGGAPVVVLPNSYVDETNTERVIHPGVAYVMPTGGADSRPVKISFEGNTLIREVQDADWSFGFESYKKIGVALLQNHHYGMFYNTSITATGFEAL